MITIQELLPDFWELSQKTAATLRAEKFSSWKPLIQQIQPILELGFIEKMEAAIPGWKKIATLNDGQTAIHTLLVFSLCLNLPEYTLFSDEMTRKEIEWAAILHDLDKNLARNDTAHPFRSAAVVARIMPQLGFKPLVGVYQSDIDNWSILVMSAQKPDGEKMVHNHTPLKKIIHDLHRCWGSDSSASRVLKAVLLHQSLPTVEDWKNAVLLNNEELAYSLTLKDMNVLDPLMVVDSDSWNIYSEARAEYLYELRANNAKTKKRIQNAEES